jgi:16S rRNA (cytosine1402-N4)-methyltransferase
MIFAHTSAMPEEAARFLDCRPGHIAVDGTLGGAGHAATICARIAPGGVFVGIDQDPDAIENARVRLSSLPGITCHLVHDNFVHLPDILSRLGIPAVDRILVDLGLSQNQLVQSGRGFSFQTDEPLDMRMDPREPTTAADLLRDLSEAELARLFQTFGEERWSARIARQIVNQRRSAPIATTAELAAIVSRAVPAARQERRIHPATRVFMALRIAVNRELDRLDRFLDHAVSALTPGGRLCVLSFHSLEDRIVKHRFRNLADPCTCPPDFPRCICGRQPTARVLTRRAVRPGDAEIQANPMARSTRLRAIEKLAATR